MQTFTGQFYVNEKMFPLGSQILFPVISTKQEIDETVNFQNFR